MPDVFRTVLNVPRAVQPITYSRVILSLGSCFAENMGERLQQLKYRVLNNPFGTLYNPLSIATVLKRLLYPAPPTADELVERHGIWHHWLYHSRFSDTDPAVALANMSTAWQQAHQQLHTADVLLVTLGTSRVYRLSETGTVVANCHQWPASTFRQEWLSAEHITSVWIELLQQLRALRPNLQVLFSVSPIRHLADGLVHNQLSKSTLLVAVHECCNQLTGVHYFPAYEAFMDDLRDYRFYAPDMVHPSEQGVEYVWQLFTTAWVQPDPLHHTMQQLHRFLNHRPRFPTSETYQRLLQQQYELIIQLEKQHPLLDFSDELQQLRQLREQYQP